MRKIIDLTHPVSAGLPVYPGDGGVRLSADQIHGTLRDGCPQAHVGRVNMGLHNGTHMDAPFHFLPGGFTIEKTPLERCFSRVTLVRLEGLKPKHEITVSHLSPFQESLQETKRLVIHSGWSKKWRDPDYFSDHPFLGVDAAQWLLDLDVDLVGLDFPSVDHPPFATHLLWLGANATIVENLTNLEQIGAFQFTLIALPLPFSGMDGSPVRAVAIVD